MRTNLFEAGLASAAREMRRGDRQRRGPRVTLRVAVAHLQVGKFTSDRCAAQQRRHRMSLECDPLILRFAVCRTIGLAHALTRGPCTGSSIAESFGVTKERWAWCRISRCSTPPGRFGSVQAAVQELGLRSSYCHSPLDRVSAPLSRSIHKRRERRR